jgi:hypothetical protein
MAVPSEIGSAEILSSIGYVCSPGYIIHTCSKFSDLIAALMDFVGRGVSVNFISAT